MKSWHIQTALALVGMVIGGVITWNAARDAEPPEPKALVAPGEVGSHYSFMSGGKGGDIRVFTVPAMRLIRVIPVFSPSAQYSYGLPYFPEHGGNTLFEKTRGEKWGRTLHPVLSQTNGKYDGKWLYVQDLPHARVARIDLRFFETDRMAKIPNLATARGLTFLGRGGREGSDYVITSGKSMTDDERGRISFLNAETLDTHFQLRGARLSNLRAGREGKRVFGVAPDAEAIAVIDVNRALKSVDTSSVPNAKDPAEIPVIDGQNDVMSLIKVSRPAGVAVTPDNRYLVVGTTGTKVIIVDAASEEAAGRLELGEEPVHSTFDSRGNVYTSLRGENQVVKWDIEKALNGGDHVRGKLAVHSRPNYLEVMQERSGNPGERRMLVYNRGGTERFLDVRTDVQNVQVVDISGESMRVIKDSPVEPTVTDAVTVASDRLNPRGVYSLSDKAVLEDESKVTRTGEDTVEVDMTAKRSEYGLDKFTVKEGDTVRLKVTNIERVKDIIHGLAINEYNINITLAPGRTRVVEFVADKPGVYHYYCTIFCSALHLEMRGRMVVEPRSAG